MVTREYSRVLVKPHAGSDEAWVAVIGDRIEGFAPQDAIGAAIQHAATLVERPTLTVRWIPTDLLESDGSEVLSGAGAVWCAPGSPYRSLTGALEGVRWAREARVPFLGTCAGFQHAVIEFARNVLDKTASHAEYGESGDVQLFIDELLCSLVGQTMRVEIVDPELLEIYGTVSPAERYYCRFGLNPIWRQPLHEAGLRIAGVDSRDGDARVMRLAGHPFYVLTLFVPQTSSSQAAPHPLITSYIRAAVGVQAAQSTH